MQVLLAKYVPRWARRSWWESFRDCLWTEFGRFWRGRCRAPSPCRRLDLKWRMIFKKTLQQGSSPAARGQWRGCCLKELSKPRGERPSRDGAVSDDRRESGWFLSLAGTVPDYSRGNGTARSNAKSRVRSPAFQDLCTRPAKRIANAPKPPASKSSVPGSGTAVALNVPTTPVGSGRAPVGLGLSSTVVELASAAA